MHIGPYDDEPVTFAKMKEYISQNGLVYEHTQIGRHYEIYLSDPRKTELSKRKTILRYQVK